MAVASSSHPQPSAPSEWTEEDIPVDAAELKRLLTCAACNRQLEQPIALPCMHNFCNHPCVQNMRERGQLTCPTCQASFIAGSEKPNFVVREILDAMKAAEQKRPENVCPFCDQQTEFKEFCLHCSMEVCRKCCLEHLLSVKDEIQSCNEHFVPMLDIPNAIQLQIIQLEDAGKRFLSEIEDNFNQSVSLVTTYKAAWDELARRIPESPNPSHAESNSEGANVQQESETVVPQPWSTIHVDFVTKTKNCHYFIAIDTTTQWPEVIFTAHAAAPVAVMSLRRIFARFGIPQTLISDDKPQFCTPQFAEFCSQHEIEYIRTPSTRQNSRDDIKYFTEEFKKWLDEYPRSVPSRDALLNFLLKYRSSPNPQTRNGISPAELLLGRKLTTPSGELTIQIPVSDFSPMDQPCIAHQWTPITEKTPKPPPHMVPAAAVMGSSGNHYNVGDEVFTCDRTGMIRNGRIVKQCGAVMYDVEVDGKMLTRHIKQLLPKSPGTGFSR
ncbi:unnamed protein product [Calicophoron daubneyi]|uniref:Integrase catalytic domain-containing protein n=1 Tax=Calicophoron daubneyi TaxID=300641 RepID=A0AAV2TP72_CALDB